MTDRVVTTTITNSTGNALDLNGGDTLLVTSGGALIGLNGNVGLGMGGAGGETATIDGLVYGAASGDGVYIGSALDILLLNGTAQGGKAGVEIYGATGAYMDVSAQGVAQGESEGVSVENSTDVTIETAGRLTGKSFGLFLGSSGNVTVNNAGAIAGEAGVYCIYETNADSLVNTGTIAATGTRALDGAVVRHASGVGPGMSIVNSGLITNSAANAANSKVATLLFDDGRPAVTATASLASSGPPAPPPKDTIDNSGRIVGAGYAIQSYGDDLAIANSGVVHGGLWTTGGSVVHLENSGVWHAGAAGTAGILLGAAGDTLTNTGVIHAPITMAAGGDQITNSGKIAGLVALTGGGGGDIISNSGVMIAGGIATTGVGDTLNNAALGSIAGPVTFSGASATVRNAGKIMGGVSLATGTSALTNSGDILGDVTFSGTGTGNLIKNAGTINGNVTMAGGSSKVANHGAIYGNVTLGGGETFKNTGIVHGDVKLGAGDVVDDSRGEVTGGFIAANADVFQFKGNFGSETISGFVAGSASTHDTIQFAASDFSSYAAVQGAMTQQGSDVLIRLDGTDSITLVGQTLANLVAADFKFV